MAISSRIFTFDHGGSSMKISYDGTQDVHTPNQQDKTVVIVQHGNSRDSAGIARSVERSAQEAGVDADDFAVFSVDFTTSSDKKSGQPYWTSSGWKGGDESVAASPGPQVSSFDVINDLIAEVSENFQNMENLVITGHSAGGQFVSRYIGGADLSSVPADVDVDFIAANPSTWMWLDEKIPYKYGLDDLNGYMAKIGADGIVDNLQERGLTIMIGTEDTSRVNDLDTSRYAELQGRNRYERAQNYDEHLDEYFNGASNHEYVEVPGVGHSHGGMYRSSIGEDLLWGDM
jgi:hypothetical protein